MMLMKGMISDRPSSFYSMIFMQQFGLGQLLQVFYRGRCYFGNLVSRSRLVILQKA